VEAASRRLESYLIDPRASAALEDLRLAYLEVFKEMSAKARDIHGMEDILAGEVETLVSRFGWAMNVIRRVYDVAPEATTAAMAAASGDTGVESPDPDAWSRA
jgi:hypothetical protein